LFDENFASIKSLSKEFMFTLIKLLFFIFFVTRILPDLSYKAKVPEMISFELKTMYGFANVINIILRSFMFQNYFHDPVNANILGEEKVK
jgi:hypothetical protein